MRIVFSTYGTFGDVNPLIALSLELKRRGHLPVLAVPEMFRPKIEPLGIGFARVRPEQDPNDTRLIAMIYDIKHGTETGLRKFLFPALRESYEDLLAAVEAEGGADLLVTGELAYAGSDCRGEDGGAVGLVRAGAVFVFFGIRSAGAAAVSGAGKDAGSGACAGTRGGALRQVCDAEVAGAGVCAAARAGAGAGKGSCL
jgi:hypothetical protein